MFRSARAVQCTSMATEIYVNKHQNMNKEKHGDLLAYSYSVRFLRWFCQDHCWFRLLRIYFMRYSVQNIDIECQYLHLISYKYLKLHYKWMDMFQQYHQISGKRKRLIAVVLPVWLWKASFLQRAFEVPATLWSSWELFISYLHFLLNWNNRSPYSNVSFFLRQSTVVGHAYDLQVMHS